MMIFELPQANATLYYSIARSLSERGCKGNQPQPRKARELMAASDDALDAVICVIVASDFISGRIHTPEDQPLAQKEGWI